MLLSKIINILIHPLFHPFFLVAGSQFFGWRGRPRVQKAFLWVAVILLLVYCFLPFAELLLQPLENAYDFPSEEAIEQSSGIIVLGGAINSGRIPAERGAVQIGSSAERVIAAVALHLQFPDKPIIFSGLSGNIIHSGWSEADATRLFLQQLEVDMTQIHFEEKSRNTHENATFSYDFVQPQKGERWLLITSARHMRRSMGSFRQASWPEMIAYPVDYHTRPKGYTLAFDPGAYNYLYGAIHEYFGLLYYRLAGFL